jgi:GntR family transcriptional regulator
MQFQVDTASRAPIYQQLAAQIRAAVARGTLKAGDRLPSVRQLSTDLVVNPNTVARGYTELEREGVVNTRPGLGVFIAEWKSELTKKVRQRRLAELVDQLLTGAVHLGFSAEEVLAVVTERLQAFRWPASPALKGDAGA